MAEAIVLMFFGDSHRVKTRRGGEGLPGILAGKIAAYSGSNGPPRGSSFCSGHSAHSGLPFRQ